MDRQRWREFFSLLENGDVTMLEGFRARLVAKLDSLPLSTDAEIIADLRRMKRLVEEELAVRSLFLEAL
jgi:hypothetical protein